MTKEELKDKLLGILIDFKIAVETASRGEEIDFDKSLKDLEALFKEEMKREWTKGYKTCLKDKVIFQNEAIKRKKANL